MLDRFEPILKIICLALAALLLFQIVHRALHIDPLGHASIPPLPRLAVEAEAKIAPTNSVAKKSQRQPMPCVCDTLLTVKQNSAGTNAMARVKPPRHGGNFGPHVWRACGSP